MFHVSRAVGRMLTMAFSLHRAADADKPTMILDSHPRTKGKSGKEYPDFKKIYGQAPKVENYQILRRAFPFVESSIVNCCCRSAWQNWLKQRTQVLTGRSRVREYRDEQPITIRDGRAKLKWDGEEFRLTFQLFAKPQKKKPVEVIVASRHIKEEWRKVLDQYAAGAKRMPAILIDCQGSRQRRKWFVHIPYEAEAIEHSNLIADRVLSVRRPDDGNGFLQCRLPQNGRAPRTEKLEWESALRAVEGVDARRKGIANKYRCDAAHPARSGHGRKRTLETSRRMRRKRANQQMAFNFNRALHIVNTAIRWKCGRIEMENLSKVPKPETLVLGKWNYYIINSRVAMLCAVHGIEFALMKPVEVITEEFKDNGEESKG
jgi:hypothetical protein